MGRGDDGMKCIEVRTLLKKGAYADAMDIVETINIDKVKSIVNLKAIASAYERVGEYAKAKAVLFQSYDIKRTKMTVYRLAYLSIKTEEFEDAEAFYQEFTEMAPDSPDRYILRYGIDRAKNVDYVLRIATLQKLKQIEYTEEWGYELAKIYHKAGLHEECIRECQDLIIWFGSGVIVDKAKLLCKYHQEGRESLDVYGVFEQDATPEQVQERREQFHVDTADYGRQTELVERQAKEEELRRQIDLDMEKTVDLRQIMGVQGDQFDLLKKEVHRVWGNPSEEHMALQKQRERAEKRVLEEPVMEPEPRPMYREETEAMLAESLAKVMDKANKGELFSTPEMQEITAEATSYEEYEVENWDDAVEGMEQWQEEENISEVSEEDQWILEENVEDMQLEEQPLSEENVGDMQLEDQWISEENVGDMQLEDQWISEENVGDMQLEEQPLSEENVGDIQLEEQPLLEENTTEMQLQEEIQEILDVQQEEVLVEETENAEEISRAEVELSIKQDNVQEQLPAEEAKEETESQTKRFGKHARRNARRAAKREKAKKAAVAKKAEQAERETEGFVTERLESIPEEMSEATVKSDVSENPILEENKKSAPDEEITVASVMETSGDEKAEEKQDISVDTEEMLMAAVDEVMAEIEEEKEKAAAEEKAKEPDFIDEYGMLLWEYFEKYQQDTRLCEDIYDALEKAMKGKRPLNFIITCKHKERYVELGQDIAKALEALGLKKTHRVGKIDAEKLNRMHLEKSYEEIKGGCILVKDARNITADTAQSIMNMINELSDEVVVILCDARPYMKDLLDEYPMMNRYFPFDIAMK